MDTWFLIVLLPWSYTKVLKVLVVAHIECVKDPSSMPSLESHGRGRASALDMVANCIDRIRLEAPDDCNKEARPYMAVSINWVTLLWVSVQ